MAEHARFTYNCLADLQEHCQKIGIDIPFSDDLSLLAEKTPLGSFLLPNRLAIHPMEGCDGEFDGRPGELTRRRYRRFAAGGAGLIWLEACAVVPEGRANPHQLWLHENNFSDYAQLVEMMQQQARQAMGANFRPMLILQLTHSGRYSKPQGIPAPIIAHHSPLDASSHVDAETHVITDDELDRLLDAYTQAAILAARAGFDGVDIKSCHRYLLSELLASFTRENSRYGGEYRYRVNFLLEAVRRIRAAVPELTVCSRLNIYDALEHPYGWGVNKENASLADLAEPSQLISELSREGLSAINVTLGNPYYRPHYNRPYDRPIAEGYIPVEHPLESINRFIQLTGQLQQQHPQMHFVGSGYSWLRQFFPYVAAGAISRQMVTTVGLGREAFAYPDFARDLLQNGKLDTEKLCIACSSCTQMMRDQVMAGCPVRDAETYRAIYRQGREQSASTK